MQIPHVIISALPMEEQDPFVKFLIGEKRPQVVDSLGNWVSAAFHSDYLRFNVLVKAGLLSICEVVEAEVNSFSWFQCDVCGGILQTNLKGSQAVLEGDLCKGCGRGHFRSMPSL